MVLNNQQNGTEAQRFVWGGAIPLQIHLHESEVTTLPPPPPALILAPRVGYLPLLAPLLMPFFSSSLPPGVDSVWFEYKGLPLKWYIPTGVLFDLLCAEPERPWNLTVHFRGYPTNVLTPCEGEDSVKWSFINALKEAAYIINGNCKNIMNMSQSDQAELWRSVLNGQLEAYLHVAHKLKLNVVEDELTIKRYSTASKPRQSNNDLEVSSTVTAGRIPVRLYIRSISEDIDDLEDVSGVDSWENVSYINRPVDLPAEGICFTLHDALKSLLPELFNKETNIKAEGERRSEADSSINREEALETLTRDGSDVVLIRIQGIESRFEIPFGWVVNNLMNPEHYLHICVYVKVVEPVTIP